MHGQEIAEEIAKRKGERPSPGTIYPALKSLREMGFIIDEKNDGKIIVYSDADRKKCADDRKKAICKNLPWSISLRLDYEND